MSSAFERVCKRLASVTGYAGYSRRSGNLVTRCPAHSDLNPSLSVTDKDDRVLIYCWAGCRIGDILKALDLQESDLFDSNTKTRRSSAFREWLKSL